MARRARLIASAFALLAPHAAAEGRIMGRILGPDGEPVAGAIVEQWKGPAGPVRTGPDGVFVLDVPGPSTGISFMARAPGLMLVEPVWVDRLHAEPWVDVGKHRLVRSGLLQVRLRDQAGSRVARSRVHVTWPGASRTVYPDSTGDFSLELPECCASLECDTPDGLVARAGHVAVTADRGGEVELVVGPVPISESEPDCVEPEAPSELTVRVQGRVSWSDGRPFAGARLTYGGQADADGRFSIRAPAGIVKLEVAPPGYSPVLLSKELELAPGTLLLADLVVDERTVLSGRAAISVETDGRAPRGRPVERVGAMQAGEHRGVVECDREGRFRLGWLDPGPVVLCAVWQWRLREIWQPLRTLDLPAAGLHGVALPSEIESVPVYLRLLDSRGEPCVGSTLSVDVVPSMGSWLVEETNTYEEGRAKLWLSPHVRYSLTVSPCTLALAARRAGLEAVHLPPVSFELAPGEQRDLGNLRLAPGKGP